MAVYTYEFASSGGGAVLLRSKNSREKPLKKFKNLMGRGKLKLELIPNEKSRRRTFEKRSMGLMKKCNELSTLCNVDVCMVINDGCRPTSSQQHTYPKNTDEVHRIIQRYLTTTTPKKMSGLSDFFMDQKKKIDSEILKVCRGKYPVSDELIDQYFPNGNSDELLRFMNLLDERIKEAEQMVNAKKQNQHGDVDDHGLNYDQNPHYPFPLNSFQAPDDQFVSNHMTNIGQAHGYQNCDSHAPSTSNYININDYYHHHHHHHPMSGSVPVVDDPTVVGMQENYMNMTFGNNNSNVNPSSSSSSSSMMMRQYYSDDQPPPFATILAPYMQYASMPLQLPGVPFDHHQRQQQMHGYYDYNDHDQKGKKVDENSEFLFENN